MVKNIIKEARTGTFFDVTKIPAKDKFFAGVKKAGQTLHRKAADTEQAVREHRKKYKIVKDPNKKSIYQKAGETVTEHRRRVVAREEYKAKKGELKVAQHIARQQLPFKNKTAYRGLSDRGVSIKKKKSKGGFF